MKENLERARELLAELLACKTVDRDLDARVAVALYSDTGRADPRDNTHARLPSKSDECAPGTYWISSFSGLSLRTAPHFSSDKLLRHIAAKALSLAPTGEDGWMPIEAVIRKWERGQNHDQGAFDPDCETCLILADLRAALSPPRAKESGHVE